MPEGPPQQPVFPPTEPFVPAPPAYRPAGPAPYPLSAPGTPFQGAPPGVQPPQATFQAQPPGPSPPRFRRPAQPAGGANYPAVVGLTLGIVAFVTGLLIMTWPIAGAAGIGAIAFGAVGIYKADGDDKQGQGVAGVVLGVLAVGLSVLGGFTTLATYDKNPAAYKTIRDAVEVELGLKKAPAPAPPKPAPATPTESKVPTVQSTPGATPSSTAESSTASSTATLSESPVSPADARKRKAFSSKSQTSSTSDPTVAASETGGVAD